MASRANEFQEIFVRQIFRSLRVGCHVAILGNNSLESWIMKPRLLLLDGHSLAYRAFYALPAENFTSSTGQQTNVVYGFASMLINLIKEEKPTHIATAFDVSRKTFRSEKFPDYKATRKPTPDEFRSQISFLLELLDAFRIPHFQKEGFEADDLLATIATRAKGAYDVYICSGDRDTFQLVDSDVTILYPKKGVTDLSRMTPDAVLEKYGLTPTQYPDFAALRGDPSDNLPSLAGVGEKTATKWIQEYGSLQELVLHADKVAGKVGQSLRDSISTVLLNRELTELDRGVAFDFDLDSMKWKGVDTERIAKLFDQLEIRTLKERIKTITHESGSEQVARSTPKKTAVAVKTLSGKELDLIIANIKVPIALSLSAPLGIIEEYAVALASDEIYHVQESQLGAWALDKKIPKILHGGKSYLRSQIIEGLFFDTELAAYLVNPGTRALELGDLVQRYLGIDIGTKVPSLFEQSDFDPESAGWIYQIHEILTKEMEERQVLSLYQDLEIPILILLAQIERIGIGIDKEKLTALESYFRSEVDRETSEAYKSVGREFNVASPKQLQVVLFDDLKLPKTKKIKTGFTTDAESLDWLFAKTSHPVLQNLLRIREAGKLRTTIQGLLSATGSDRRIHTTFQQSVAATGRLSSTEPNLQNIPVRTEEGRKIRDCFVAQIPYKDLMTADYSQIEMRIMAHLSEDAQLLHALETGEDLHTTVASEVFGVDAKEVNPEMRRQIKAMSYGLAYGLSSFGLAQQLNLSPSGASALMERYFERFGGIQIYLKSVVAQAREKGYTETILGRRRYLPDLTHDNRQRREVAERMALNAPIQGSAADIIKVAMLRVEKEIVKTSLKSRLLLQVHDELIFEVADDERQTMEDLVRREMGSAYPLKAKLDVNVGFGLSWDLAAH